MTRIAPRTAKILIALRLLIELSIVDPNHSEITSLVVRCKTSNQTGSESIAYEFTALESKWGLEIETRRENCSTELEDLLAAKTDSMQSAGQE